MGYQRLEKGNKSAAGTWGSFGRAEKVASWHVNPAAGTWGSFGCAQVPNNFLIFFEPPYHPFPLCAVLV